MMDTWVTRYGGVMACFTSIEAGHRDLSRWNMRIYKHCAVCQHSDAVFHVGIPYGVNIVVVCARCQVLSTKVRLDKHLISDYAVGLYQDGMIVYHVMEHVIKTIMEYDKTHGKK